MGLALALLLAALHVPRATDVLPFAPLPAHERAAAVALGLLSVVGFEGTKALRPRPRPERAAALRR